MGLPKSQRKKANEIMKTSKKGNGLPLSSLPNNRIACRFMRVVYHKILCLGLVFANKKAAKCGVIEYYGLLFSTLGLASQILGLGRLLC